MKKFVTLNEYIASLQKIAETHGEEELMATGACCGVYEGLNSPLSIRLGKPERNAPFMFPPMKKRQRAAACTKTAGFKLPGEHSISA